jgi:hypothetical protein
MKYADGRMDGHVFSQDNICCAKGCHRPLRHLLTVEVLSYGFQNLVAADVEEVFDTVFSGRCKGLQVQKCGLGDSNCENWIVIGLYFICCGGSISGACSVGYQN